MANAVAPPLKVLQGCGFGNQKEFSRRGAAALELLGGLGALEEGKTVVDLGCKGHVAAALESHPKPPTYHGVGLDANALKWCTEHLKRGKFWRLDIRDAVRNPGGAVLPEKVVLPFGEGFADVVYAESVFTTMAQSALRRHIAEVSRILKPGGRFVATFFLLNGDSMARISQRRTRYGFPHRVDTYCRAQEKDRPGSPIAYNDSFIRMLGAPVGIHVKDVRGGSWAGVDGAKLFEDVVIAEKSAIAKPDKADPKQNPKKPESKQG